MLIRGDSVRGLPLADCSVQCVVTSPPYWGLRDYGVAGQMGLEATLGEYIEKMVAVGREIWRVLKDDGVVWLNFGDAYFNSDKWGGGHSNTGKHTKAKDGSVPSFHVRKKRVKDAFSLQARNQNSDALPRLSDRSLKPKDLIGMPWRVALALQADGWWLRSDVIWNKPNPMPESVVDRPTRSHEYLFLLTKNARYFYDADAIRESMAESTVERLTQLNVMTQPGGPRDDGTGNRSHSKVRKNLARKLKNNGVGWNRTSVADPMDNRNSRARIFTHGTAEKLSSVGRNKRDVWTVATMPCAEAHFATFPEKLVEPCILAGSRPGDVVLDPFSGTGTVERVATRLVRRGVGLELNPAYIEIALKLQRDPRKNQLEIAHG